MLSLLSLVAAFVAPYSISFPMIVLVAVVYTLPTVATIHVVCMAALNADKLWSPDRKPRSTAYRVGFGV